MGRDKWLLPVHIVLFLLLVSSGVAYGLETVRLVNSTYQTQEGFGFTESHWGITEINQILDDIGGIPVSSDEIYVRDVVLIQRPGRFEIYGINTSVDNNHGDGNVGYMWLNSSEVMTRSEALALQSLDYQTDGQTPLAASGIDAWIENDETTCLAVCEYESGKILMYHVTAAGAELVRTLDYPEIFAQPIDVARYRAGVNNNPPYVAVLSYDGNVLAVFNYLDQSLYGGVVAVTSLPESALPEGLPEANRNIVGSNAGLVSQHGRIYTFNRERKLLYELTITQNGIDILEVHELGANADPIAISGDQLGSVFLADHQNSRIRRFTSNLGPFQYSGPLLEVDDFGQGQGETFVVQSPTALASTQEDLFVFELPTDDRGVVHGKIGGKIENFAALPVLRNTTQVQLLGTSTGTIYQVTVHSRSVTTNEVQSTLVADMLPAGRLRQTASDPLVLYENRPYGQYEIWMTWTSLSCTSPEGYCSAPEMPIVVRCGVPPSISGMVPTAWNCSEWSSDIVRVCYEREYPQIEGPVRFFVKWREETGGEWTEIYSHPWSPVELYDTPPLQVYDVRISIVQNGLSSQENWSKVARSPQGLPSDLAIAQVTSNSITLRCTVPSGANGIELRYGSEENNLAHSTIQGGVAGTVCTFALTDASHLLRHDAINYFRARGVVLSGEWSNYVAAVGGYSPVLSSPLAPTTSGTITWPERWFQAYLGQSGPVLLPSGLTVGSGGSLTIEYGIDVKVGTDQSITVEPGGQLRVLGLSSNATVNFSSIVSGQRWAGIRVYSNSLVNTIRHSLIEHAATGLWVSIGYCYVQGSYFRNCGRGMIWTGSDGTICDCNVSSNDTYGAYLIDSQTDVSDCMIHLNGWGGLRIWRAGQNVLANNTIEHNGRANPTGGYCAGVQLLQGAMAIGCNDIVENEGPGLMLFSMTYADMSDHGGYNSFYNNCEGYVATPRRVPVDYGQVTLVGGMASLECGFNSIHDDGQPYQRELITSLFPDLPVTGWPAQHNYWGVTDTVNIQYRTPSNPILSPVLTGPERCPDPFVIDACGDDPEYNLFRSAWNQEMEGSFQAAVASYDFLIRSYPDGKYAKVALERLASCKKLSGMSWSDIRQYFFALAADSSKSVEFVCLCKSNAAWCLTEMADYQGALAELDSLLDHNSVMYLEQYLALKTLLTELKQDDYELLNEMQSTTRGSKNLDSGVLRREQSFSEIEGRVDSVLMFLTGSAEQDVLPYSYSLYQNYPNPFNPNTEIRFDIPDAVRVELKIFNILGQEVTTLVDDVRAAGAYRILWDGKNAGGLSVASGVYVYQLKAGNFQDAKKMVLIR